MGVEPSPRMARAALDDAFARRAEQVEVGERCGGMAEAAPVLLVDLAMALSTGRLLRTRRVRVNVLAVARRALDAVLRVQRMVQEHGELALVGVVGVALDALREARFARRRVGR